MNLIFTNERTNLYILTDFGIELIKERQQWENTQLRSIEV